MNALIDAENLHFAYKNVVLVIQNVSLSIEPASMVAIIGANGSGKSTLISLFAGLLRSAAGRILMEGRALASWPAELRAQQIAYLLQTTAMAFPFKAIDFVLSGRTHTRRVSVPRTVAVVASHASRWKPQERLIWQSDPSQPSPAVSGK